MTLTHLTGEDFRGRPMPLFLFECEKSEKDLPKVAGFKFGPLGGVTSPPNRWTTTDPAVAKKLVQYADEPAQAALRAAGITDLDKARRNAVKREKALESKERHEVASMTREEREREIGKWLGFAEQDADRKGYVSANCTNQLRKLGAFHDPLVERRYDAAVARARVVACLKNTGGHLAKLESWLPANWHLRSATAVEDAVFTLRRAGETEAADRFEADYRRLRERFDLGRRRGFEAPKPAYPFSLVRGSGPGGRAFECGSVVRNPEASPSEGRPEWLKVCREGHKYVARGGMEAGVGAERGYLYWADCREADPAEAGRAAAEWEVRRRWSEKRAAALAEWRRLAAKVCREGVHEPGPVIPRGRTVEHPLVDPAHGDCFVIGEDSVWHIQANPAEGAHRALNNVRHHGREAIGHRVPFSQVMEVSILAAVAVLAMPKPPVRGEVDFNEPCD